MPSSCASLHTLDLGLSPDRMEEEESAIEGLMLLWRRLHAEMQRIRASPATRLLDDVLRAMNPASQLDFSERQEVCWTPALRAPACIRRLLPLLSPARTFLMLCCHWPFSS